jgi:hypothetical protein
MCLTSHKQTPCERKPAVGKGSKTFRPHYREVASLPDGPVRLNRHTALWQQIGNQELSLNGGPRSNKCRFGCRASECGRCSK